MHVLNFLAEHLGALSFMAATAGPVVLHVALAGVAPSVPCQLRLWLPSDPLLSSMEHPRTLNTNVEPLLLELGVGGGGGDLKPKLG